MKRAISRSGLPDFSPSGPRFHSTTPGIHHAYLAGIEETGKTNGVTTLVRLAVGLEDVADLLADIEQALHIHFLRLIP